VGIAWDVSYEAVRRIASHVRLPAAVLDAADGARNNEAGTPEEAGMPLKLQIPFAAEAEALRKQLRGERRLTPSQRLRAVADAVAAAEALSHAGKVREAQLRYHQGLEKEWQRRMKEFIARHVTS
jgi:hypothetical protein